MLLNNSRIKEESKRESRKFYKLNENENMTYQNLWEVAKSMLTVKFIALNVCRKVSNQ